MLRRSAVMGCVLGWLLSGCKGSSNEPVSIALSPEGTVAVNGPVLFTATVKGTTEVPTWSLSGPGSLSGMSGIAVTYRPPATRGTAESAEITASAGGASASAQLTLAPGGTALTSAIIPGLTQPVDVLFDPQGIPHIQCAAMADCLAVQGYLHARDRLFQMDFFRRTARGKLAELVGPLGLATDAQVRTLFTARDGRRLEDALASAMDAPTLAKVQAYVNGVNAYLHGLQQTQGAKLPGEYAQLPVPNTPAGIPDWSVADVTALMRLQQFQLSETLNEETAYGKFAQTFGPGAPHEDAGKMRTWMRSARPAGAQAPTLTGAAGKASAEPMPRAAPPRGGGKKGKSSLATPLVAWKKSLGELSSKLAVVESILRPLDGSFGSNNWVVDATHSANGKAMVANDPHLSLQYPPNFHLAALTSSNAADNLDVTGGSFPGVPGALVGRGKNVGWGVTVVGYDVTDLYLEQVAPCPAGVPAAIPFCVLSKGQPAPVLPVPQTFMVRTAAGLVDAKTLPAAQRPPPAVIVVPAHGPIIQAPDQSGRAVSVRWTGHETWTQDIKAFIGLNTAPDVDSAMAALNDYATGAQNFVLADDRGHIAYDPHALVPVRRFADPVALGDASKLQAPWLPLRGHDGSAEWGTGEDSDHCAGVDLTAFPPTPVTPAPTCWIAKDKLPQGKDPAKGFFATANSDPLGKGDANNPLAPAAQPYLSFDWSDPTGIRIERITQRLTELTAGGGKVSLADMEALQSDHVSLFGGLLVPAVLSAAFDNAATANADFKAARDVLASWKTNGYGCPTGLTGADPQASPADSDARASANSAGCYLFHAFARKLIFNVFSDDLSVGGLRLDGGPAVRGILHLLQPDTPAEDQTFCWDIDSKGAVARTSCGEQVVKALVAAHKTLSASLGPTSEWRWGRAHTMQPFSYFPTVTHGYEPGPFARPGGAFTVDVGNPSLTASGLSFGFASSANVRHISVMDPANPVVKMQLPGPQRALPADVVQGPDLLGQWVRNEYFDYPHGDQIRAVAVATQRFTAQ